MANTDKPAGGDPAAPTSAADRDVDPIGGAGGSSNVGGAERSEPSDRRFDSDRKLLGDLVKKAVTTGINTMLNTEEGVRAVVGAVAQKDIIGTAVHGVDATRREAVAIVGREVHNFLESLNLSEEIAKILTSVSFEIRTEVRFVPNEEGKLRAKVTAGARPKVKVAQGEAHAAAAQESAADQQAEPDANQTTRKAARRAVVGLVERLAEATAGAARAAAEIAAEAAVDVVNEARGHQD